MRVRTSNMFLSRDWRMHRREIHLSGAGVGVLKLCHCRRWGKEGQLAGSERERVICVYAPLPPYFNTQSPAHAPLCLYSPRHGFGESRRWHAAAWHLLRHPALNLS